MAAKILSEVTLRQKLCEYVEFFIRAHSTILIERLTPVLRRALAEGQELPDVLGILNVLMARLSLALTVLKEAERVHLNETGDDSDVREERVSVTGVVRKLMIDTRESCRLAFGRPKAATIGYENRIAQDPVALARQGSRVLTNFQSGELELPEARYALAVTAQSMVDVLETPVHQLIALNDAITHERTSFQGTLVAKKEAMKDYDRTYSQTVQILRGFFRAAGLTELAQRMLRTVPKRPARDEDIPDPVTAADPASANTSETVPASATDSTHGS